jgi:predicted HicB family RNase H-like nuclease
VPIDLPEDELLKICMAAHKLDLTLNEYVEQVLKEVIERHSLEK